VFASGSGGTAVGIALGLALVHQQRRAATATTAEEGAAPSAPRSPPPQVHAVGVCDTPDYFYDQVTKIAMEMGLTLSAETSDTPSAADVERFVRKHLTVHQGKGLGYAVSTPDELEFVAAFARETGIVLDPVYTGKALYQFLQFVQTQDEDPDAYRNKTVLFWHTGGALGLYDKVDESFLSLLQGGSPCHRLDVYGKGYGIDFSSTTLGSA
jgi:D-cysteine desulfhydrase